ncbi:MAG: hypothetical protein LBJ36_10405 [Synergistaceae bacterium]|nr:hypothetical protein [Synergistaceae bacterium]
MISTLVFHVKSDIINKQQATSNKQQATSNKQQATSNKQQFLQFLKVLFLFDTITIAASFGRVFTCLNEAVFLS